MDKREIDFVAGRVMASARAAVTLYRRVRTGKLASVRAAEKRAWDELMMAFHHALELHNALEKPPPPPPEPEVYGDRHIRITRAKVLPPAPTPAIDAQPKRTPALAAEPDDLFALARRGR